MEHHLRMHKLTSVLLTEIATHTVGGLPGMILTVSGSGKEGLRVYGPKGTSQFVHATRHFVYRPEFQLQVDEAEAAAATTTPAAMYCQDEDVAVRSIPVSPRDLDHAFVSYVVETPEQRGKFLVDKALALGVPRADSLDSCIKERT
ncbi:hypothetical protein PINS_up016903 [Pythium insidiosum]|nr:hypothetical protein PINS_up016903 [Pythium insidiosum]